MIISASRYEDIPTFRSDFLFKCFINDKKIIHKNPRGTINEIDLSINNINGIVFWTKNIYPCLNTIKILKDNGYNFYILNTYTNYSKEIELNVNHENALKGFLECKKNNYDIIWRYDPIIVSENMNYKWHIKNFTDICNKLKGVVTKCYFSFITIYDKIKENFKLKNINIIENELNNKKLIKYLSEIAFDHNIKMYTCANDKYISSNIYKGHCIDPDIVKTWNEKPEKVLLRKDCGCVKSYDIGTYNTCKHGCIYCYANTTKLTKLINNI